MMLDKKIKKAFQYCESVSKNHYENFPVASFLLPAQQRPYVFAIYAYARLADDIVDENRMSHESADDLRKREQQLNEIESKLEQLHNHKLWEQCSDHLFLALYYTVKDCKIPVDLLLDLLKAYRLDIHKNRYDTFDDLLHYCKYSANPIGRILLHIFGYHDPNFHWFSDQICTGLQLANFWQDISTDIQKNRLYLPKDLLNQFHVHEDEIFSLQHSFRITSLVQACIDKTEKIFYDGLPLCHILATNLRYEIRWTWLRGIKILQKTAQYTSKILTHRPVMHPMDAILLFFKSFFFRYPLSIQRLNYDLHVQK